MNFLGAYPEKYILQALRVRSSHPTNDFDLGTGLLMNISVNESDFNIITSGHPHTSHMLLIHRGKTCSFHVIPHFQTCFPWWPSLGFSSIILYFDTFVIIHKFYVFKRSVCLPVKHPMCYLHSNSHLSTCPPFTISFHTSSGSFSPVSFPAMFILHYPVLTDIYKTIPCIILQIFLFNINKKPHPITQGSGPK